MSHRSNSIFLQEIFKKATQPYFSNPKSTLHSTNYTTTHHMASKAQLLSHDLCGNSRAPSVPRDAPFKLEGLVIMYS